MSSEIVIRSALAASSKRVRTYVAELEAEISRLRADRDDYLALCRNLMGEAQLDRIYSKDRQIHARTRSGWLIVRYDRAGKWYAESPEGGRRRLTLEQAVAEATEEGSYVYLGMAGGRKFDAKVKAAAS